MPARRQPAPTPRQPGALSKALAGLGDWPTADALLAFAEDAPWESLFVETDLPPLRRWLQRLERDAGVQPVHRRISERLLAVCEARVDIGEDWLLVADGVHPAAPNCVGVSGRTVAWSSSP